MSNLTARRGVAPAVSTSAPAPLRASSERQRPARIVSFVRGMPLTIVLCFLLLSAMILTALLAPVLAPHDPLQQNLMNRNQPPVWLTGGSWSHPLGTDQIGYDILSRTIYGARPALGIGFVAVLIGLTLGTSLGLVAGYFRGITDSTIMLLADAQLSTPFLVVAIAAVAAFGRSILILIILAGISGWMGFARTVRSQVLTLRGREFIVASHAMGASNRRILLRHLLPNLASIVIVLVTIQLRGMILFEASLSFLGLGVPPPHPSWGSMISNGREYILTAWWISVMPGIALMLTILTVSLIGDWLRDVFDPSLRGLR
jgi:peptide/nickel transport system permease protein